MLNIPEAVKQLYKEETTESIRKNLRITFPDGQLSDDFPHGITCNNIVAESMRFTESVCSQDNFKFGTSEAPVIEFETVGVPNILGFRIQAWLEIETTTIGHVYGGDGVYVPLADSDLGFAYYRLPLGVFTVQSCPRSHGAMTHRQITAYGRSWAAGSAALDDFSYFKLRQMYQSDTYEVGFNFFAPTIYGKASPYFNAESKAGTWESQANYTCTIYFGSGAVTQISPNTDSVGWLTNYRYAPTTSTLMRVYRTGLTRTKLVDAVSGAAETAFANSAFSGVDWGSSYYLDGETQVPLGSLAACIDFITDSFFPTSPPKPTARTELYAWQPEFRIETSPSVFYSPDTYYADIDLIVDFTLPNSGDYWSACIAYGFGFFSAQYYENGTLKTYASDNWIEVPGITYGIEALTVKPEYAIDIPTLTLPHTLETQINGTPYYSFYNSFSPGEFLSGFFEIRGELSRTTRFGAVMPFALSNVAVESLTQGDVEALWWDDSEVNKVGRVQVTYLDADLNEESSAVIQIGSGISIYDMTNNYYFKKWPITLSALTALIQGAFSTATDALTWTPTDATVRGLPYLEAGDWIEAATGAEDVTEVGVPILRRELTGIQSLTDTITSVAGEIIEVQASEWE